MQDPNLSQGLLEHDRLRGQRQRRAYLQTHAEQEDHREQGCLDED